MLRYAPSTAPRVTSQTGATWQTDRERVDNIIINHLEVCVLQRRLIIFLNAFRVTAEVSDCRSGKSGQPVKRSSANELHPIGMGLISWNVLL